MDHSWDWGKCLSPAFHEKLPKSHFSNQYVNWNNYFSKFALFWILWSTTNEHKKIHMLLREGYRVVEFPQPICCKFYFAGLHSPTSLPWCLAVVARGDWERGLFTAFLHLAFCSSCMPDIRNMGKCSFPSTTDKLCFPWVHGGPNEGRNRHVPTQSC